MNPTEPRDLPLESSTRVPSLADALTPPPDEPRPARRAGQEPRYVPLPGEHHEPTGSRNLVFGGGALFLALLIGGAALFVVGPRAIVPLIACLFTFCVLYALARLQIFREPHGAFLALGIVCLLGAVLALFERAFHGLDGSYWTPLAPPPVTIVHPPAATPAPDALPTLLTTAFALNPPDPKAGPRVRAIKDSRVFIEGKPFLIKAGDLFPLADATLEEVTFKVRDLRIALPAGAVEVLEDLRTDRTAAAAPPAEKSAPAPTAAAALSPVVDAATAEATKRAQAEAMRRYPALSIEGSRENVVFVSTYREFKNNVGEDFFRNPEWPLELAELLAKREGWVRDDLPVKPAPVSVPSSRVEDAQLPLLEN